MIIELINLPGGPFAFEFTLKPDEADLQGEDVRFRGDVAVSGEIEKVSGRYVVRGTIESDQSLDCSRCLEPIETKSTIRFDVGYIAAENEAREHEHELTAEDLDIDVLEGDQLDLNELAREQILLAVPEQVFCKEDCKGLCEKCGSNRNLIDCNCKDKEIDPRWSALRDFK
jgi:uncharacterized protein